ncbi:unnamed protein product [Prorocentrum cordatum]|uniref:Uncharacterized protein n=1 Tax=Prorocentrum cordatum TaxID=2364126 RepID=A0ABN9USR8_9DINO|nr:unnamed protein product [Polarella glacialis]
MATVGCQAAPVAAEQPRQAGGAAASLWPARRARQCAARSAAHGKLAAALARVATLEAELADCRAVRGEAAAQAVRIAALPLGSQQVPDDVLVQELATRLALAVPVLMDMLADRRAAAVGAAVPRAAPTAPPPCGGSSGTQCGTLGADISDELASSLTVDGAASSGACRRAPPLATARRNAGMHCASRRGASIAKMRLTSLNRLQRSGPGCRPRQGRGAGGSGRAALPQLRPAGAVVPHRRVPAQRSAAEGVATGWCVARRRGRSLPAGASFALAELVRSASHHTAAPLASGPLWWHAGVEGLDDSALARPESSGGFGEHPAPRPSEGGAVHPHRLPDPGAACSTACTSSPAAFADPSIVTAYLLANESAVLSGGSEIAAGDIDGEFSMQEVGSRNQDGDRSLASDAVAHGGFDLSPHLGTDDGVEAAEPQRNGGRSLDDDALLTSPPSGSCSCSGGGGIDEEDGEGGVGDGCTLRSDSVARQGPARGPKRLLALRRHVFAGFVALTVDRDIRRPGWQGAGGDDAPPAPSASEREAGRLWLRDTFGPGSPWRTWARQERRRRREAQLQQ